MFPHSPEAKIHPISSTALRAESNRFTQRRIICSPAEEVPCSPKGCGEKALRLQHLRRVLMPTAKGRIGREEFILEALSELKWYLKVARHGPCCCIVTGSVSAPLTHITVRELSVEGPIGNKSIFRKVPCLRQFRPDQTRALCVKVTAVTGV